MCLKPAGLGCLVVDFLFEQNHFLAEELVEEAQHWRSEKQTVEPGMMVREILGGCQRAMAVRIYLLVVQPRV